MKLSQVLIVGVLASICLASRARADLVATMHANKDIDASYSIVSSGSISAPGDFKDSTSPRCALWGGQDGHWVAATAIHAGQNIIISADPQQPLSADPTIVLRLVDDNGKQFAGLTCAYMDEKVFSIDAASIRKFLKSQFGLNADFN